MVKEVAAFEWEMTSPSSRPLFRALVLVAAGLLLLAAGGHYLVLGAVALARKAGISETVIGLTLVAVGTSLPELATSLVAALRGETAISIGNLVGSNLFNILCVLGLSSIVAPDGIIVSKRALEFDIPVMIAGTANSPSVAEQAMFMMLWLAKRSSELDSVVRGGKWFDRPDCFVEDSAEIMSSDMRLDPFGIQRPTTGERSGWR